MEEAAEADYVVIIDGGKIVAKDTPNNLKNQFAYDFIKIYQFDNKLLDILKKKKIEFNQQSDDRAKKHHLVFKIKLNVSCHQIVQLFKFPSHP